MCLRDEKLHQKMSKQIELKAHWEFLSATTMTKEIITINKEKPSQTISEHFEIIDASSLKHSIQKCHA